MNNDRVSFDSLRKVLLDLGFVETLVPGPYLLFEHASSGTLLPYHAYKPGETVSWADLVMTRRLLDERGIMEQEELATRFEKALVPNP